MARTAAVIAVAASTWLTAVSRTVTEPYLDEIFHVRQAQHYCAGHYEIWDPKITTPAALYRLSSITPLKDIIGCSLLSLRAYDVLAICLLASLLPSLYYLRTVRNRLAFPTPSFWDEHNALNICLFPPLFFFSALYYTDVASTLAVLVFWFCDLNLHWFARSPALVLLGGVALGFRQTNIFWVAVFPAAIRLVRELDQGHHLVKESMYKGAEGFGDSVMSVLRTSWRHDVVYNPPVREAWIEDHLTTLLSIAVCTAKAATRPSRLHRLVSALSPYLTLLVGFLAFVLYNGGVVLGDKSNHVATLHLPQMLYLWPYLAFFSWPLLFPYLLLGPLRLVSSLLALAHWEPLLLLSRRNLLPRWWLAMLMVTAACVIVRFNTIVHPFTLADNRHYTFYVFRLLLRHPATKYLVTPVYILCGWACIEALGAEPNRTSYHDELDPQSSNTNHTPATFPNGATGASTSFVLIWLATTALQLITAPLVEPRYFILPWIFWRLHVSTQRAVPATTGSSAIATRFVQEVWKEHDHRLWLETAWFVLVNVVTGYIFLIWGFEWKQEPGLVQRFMW